MRRLVCLLALLLACCTRPAGAYSLLTHEQLIDLSWQSSIVPLLLSRYPTLAPAELEHARAYAYGGCVIQDIGYYPFGDVFFSDLTHYVRSGDFIVNLFRDAGNADELAFAIGALSHYIGDSIGHQDATNRAVPVEFPKLARRYGNSIPYAEGAHQHVQTEFAFDINEIAHHRFAPVRYLRAVGLEVPSRQLSLAFYQTYGVREAFDAPSRRLKINTGAYRFAVHGFIPRIAYAVTLLHRKGEPDDTADADFQRMSRQLAAVAQANQWDTFRRKPGIGTYSLAGLLYILPKIGALKLVAIKGPTAATETAYVHSVMRSTDALNAALRRFTPPPAAYPAAAAAAADLHSEPPPGAPLAADPAGAGSVVRTAADGLHPLANRDLDTGYPTRPAGYRLTDDTYERLVLALIRTPAAPVPIGVKAEILLYYADLTLPFNTRKDPTRWKTLVDGLATLRAMPATAEPDPFPTYGEAGNDPDGAGM